MFTMVEKDIWGYLLDYSAVYYRAIAKAAVWRLGKVIQNDDDFATYIFESLSGLATKTLTIKTLVELRTRR